MWDEDQRDREYWQGFGDGIKAERELYRKDKNEEPNSAQLIINKELEKVDKFFIRQNPDRDSNNPNSDY